MVHRIVYHPSAEAEVDRLYADIATNAGTGTAGDFIDGLLSFVEALDTFPERGTVRESRVPGLRIIGYRRSVSIAFCVRGEEVIILGVFGRGRDITDDVLEERGP